MKKYYVLCYVIFNYSPTIGGVSLHFEFQLYLIHDKAVVTGNQETNGNILTDSFSILYVSVEVQISDYY